jgi:hypothetical protein
VVMAAKKRPAGSGGTGRPLPRPVSSQPSRAVPITVRDQRTAYARWRRGQAAAARRQQELMVSEGARPEVAIAESRAAANALDQMSGWPSERDGVAAHAIAVVRRRWARVEQRAKHARKG